MAQELRSSTSTNHHPQQHMDGGGCLWQREDSPRNNVFLEFISTPQPVCNNITKDDDCKRLAFSVQNIVIDCKSQPVVLILNTLDCKTPTMACKVSRPCRFHFYLGAAATLNIHNATLHFAAILRVNNYRYLRQQSSRQRLSMNKFPCTGSIITLCCV